MPYSGSASDSKFRKTYFHASLVGYFVGMLLTLGAMHFMDHAQPALLWLVPSVLTSLWGSAFLRGELSEMWAFTELEEEGGDEVDKKSEDDGTETNGDKKIEHVDDNSQLKGDSPLKHKKAHLTQPSILSSTHDSRREESVRRALSKHIQAGDSDSDSDDLLKSERTRRSSVARLEKSFRRDRRNDLVFFSVSRYNPLRNSRGEVASSDVKEKGPKWVTPSKQQAAPNGEPGGKRLRVQ